MIWPHAPESRFRNITAIVVLLGALIIAPFQAGSLSALDIVLPAFSVGSLFVGFVIPWMVLGIQRINPLCSVVCFRRMCLFHFYVCGGALVLFTPIAFFAPIGLPLFHDVPPSDLALGIASLPLPLGAAWAAYYLYRCNL